MSEREQPEPPYWQEQLALGRTLLGDRDVPLYLSLHQSRERITRHDEIIPLAHPTGERTYFHAKPFVLDPDIRLGVQLYPTPQETGAIGTVTSSFIEGVRRREIGQAQAWYYPRDRVALLWECYLLDQYQASDLFADRAVGDLWRGFERTVMERSPGVEQLVTTWEDIYQRDDWKRFLTRQGYTQTDPAVFRKPVR